FKDKVYWTAICQKQKLSEDFIREFKDKVNWQWISLVQNFSFNFVKEFQDNLNLKKLEEREIIKIKESIVVIEPAENILKSVECQSVNKFEFLDI
ncbi:hypothetical protein LCGC14_2165090, partial [marine sediment metagenome]